jgi:hypothetical protein
LCRASKPVTNYDPSKLCPSQCEASWRRIFALGGVGAPETTRIESSESRRGEGDVSGWYPLTASDRSLQPLEGEGVLRG